MKYRLTKVQRLAAMFTVNAKAQLAGESWERENPGHFFDIDATKWRMEDVNIVAVYEENHLGQEDFLGWLADIE